MITNVIKLIVLILFINVISCKKSDSEPEKDFEIREVVGDYYVSLNGNDDNPGSKDEPWRTIQKAVNTVEPGKIAVVLEGNYDEFVTFKNSGVSDSERIMIFSEALHGAKCRGFRIEADYITIDGFDVEAQGTTNWVGINIYGNSDITILNCYVHECPTGGINVNNGAINAIVKDNKIEHNGQWGINLVGFYGLIEGNEISRTVQYHPKGDEPGFSGNDADGMRVFGYNHIIRSNRFLNIGDPNDSGNKDPHVDCIQAWDGNSSTKPIVTNTIIEANYFNVNHPSGKGILIDATKGNACHDLTIRNNVFEICDMGIGLYDGEFYNIRVLNNVFKANIGQSSWGTSVSFRDITNYSYINNITVDCHPQHRYIIGGSGNIDYNLAWSSDGTTPSLTPELQANELISVDPLFSKYTGTHGENNYQLKSESPAIDAGFALDNVKFDYFGIDRPQGVGYDIGAFEFK